VAPADLRRLSRVDPRRAACHIALEWAAILLAAVACWRFWNPLLYVVTVAFIGARQHALLILMHDASHHRLFRHRRLNDWVGEVSLAWPFLAFSMRDYRRSHYAHHRWVNTAQDPDWLRKQTPDWEFPKRPAKLAKLLLGILCGGGVLRQIDYARRVSALGEAGSDDASGDRAFAVGRVAFLSILATTVIAGNLLLPFLCFWVVPFLTWTQLVLHLRSIAEHFALAGTAASGIYSATRNTLANRFDRVFIASKNIGLHLDHHLYPSVPFHRLGELHELLMRDAGYRAAAHHTRGYWRVLLECTAMKKETT
jgi:fatty acid desaturase